MKKFISAILLTILATSAMVFADTTPVITTSTEREIRLDAPQGKYVNGIFMAPVRRICEMFDASCDWYEEERMIILNTKDNMTRVFLWLEQDEFRIFTFTGVISGSGENFKLDAPLEIVDDRTLVPFEQICKALKGECTWAEDKSSVTVSVNEPNLETRAGIYLTADKEDVSAGEELVLTINVKNSDILPEYGVSGYGAGIIYDKTQFEYVASTLIDSEGNDVASINLESRDYSEDSSKALCLGAVPFEYGNEEVCLGKVVLKALTDDGGEIRLSNRVYTGGDDTHLVYMQKTSDLLATVNRGSQLEIDTNPITIK